MSSDINHLSVSGQLTRDTEAGFSDGEPVVRLSLMCVLRDQQYRREPVISSDILTVIVPGELPTWSRLEKGTEIIVEGRLVSRGDQDGSSYPRVEIMAERIVPIPERRKG